MFRTTEDHKNRPDVDQVDRERRVKMAVRSALLLECLERSGYFPEGSADEDKDRVLRRLYDFQGERVSISPSFLL